MAALVGRRPAAAAPIVPVAAAAAAVAFASAAAAGRIGLYPPCGCCPDGTAPRAGDWRRCRRRHRSRTGPRRGRSGRHRRRAGPWRHASRRRRRWRLRRRVTPPCRGARRMAAEAGRARLCRAPSARVHRSGRPWITVVVRVTETALTRVVPPGAPRGAGAQVLRPHMHRAGHALRRTEHARLHAVGRQRRMGRPRDEAWRDAGVDRDARAVHRQRAVDDAGAAQEERRAARAARNSCAAGAPRCSASARTSNKPARPRKRRSPRRAAVRRPADGVVAITPVDPGRRPFVARHPEPAEAAVEGPAAVVIGHPAPIRFLVVGNPVPAPLVGKDPVADFVGTPVARQAGRHPDFAEARMPAPFAVLFERVLEFGRDLRISGRERADENRCRDTGNGERQAGRDAEQEAAENGFLQHFLVPISDRMTACNGRQTGKFHTLEEPS